MPKKIDRALRERTVMFVLGDGAECPSKTGAIAAVARQEKSRNGVLTSVGGPSRYRGWRSQEYAEIRRIKAENKRLREDVAILNAATTFLAHHS